jgi:hypothetical protein
MGKLQENGGFEAKGGVDPTSPGVENPNITAADNTTPAATTSMPLVQAIAQRVQAAKELKKNSLAAAINPQADNATAAPLSVPDRHLP